MKYKLLRSHLKRNSKKHSRTLKDCTLVIDGSSCFKDAYSYKKSGCQFILGGEYDRYASYLKNILKPFVENNITCVVIFNGGMKVDLERRKEIHQNVINNRDAIQPGRDENIYCEPIFVQDVQREVLEELGIQYYVTEYNNKEAMFTVAKYFDCPILTNNFEYRLYGVKCIVPNSLIFSNTISCDVLCKVELYMPKDMIPIFLTLIDEDSSFFKKLPRIINCQEKNLIASVLRWATRQSKDVALKDVLKNLKDETEREIFINTCEEHTKLCKADDQMAIQYFESGMVKNDYFLDRVANGKIAVPYINLKNNATFSGSWLIVDKEKDDAILPAIDIPLFIYGILTNSENVKITFIGRKLNKSEVWDIEGEFRATEGLLKKIQNSERHVFNDYVRKILPGFVFMWLKPLPEDCWVLIIACLYFCKRNKDFINFAYSFMLSYVMLGPVSEKVGVIKKSNFLSLNDFDKSEDSSEDMKTKDCALATIKLIDLFYADKIISIFNRRILHSLAEFQHYLQHLNYLNKFCGGTIKCTVYHKVLNISFVYNVYQKIEKDNSLKYFETTLCNSPVLTYFKKMINVFDECLNGL